MSSTTIPKVVPAQLSFLAIYNPSLGYREEDFHQQIVFYYSKAAKSRSKLRDGDTKRERELREQENEKLRQVGLAQGMVGFAKSFANGEAVDSVETQKSRIVLHELEDSWWILASIDLTQLPASNSALQSNPKAANDPAIEYSSREVSPPALLIQQLVRAQSIFLLHHGTTLAMMLYKHGRTKFCNILETYWSRFAATWDVLLHGSPAVDIYNGMKLAAGGELGMGVGEEDWGSSERDVLEDFARRTEGLVDVMVARFGEASPLQQAKSSADPKLLDASEDEPWLGSGKRADAADGVVFSGLGDISRKSRRDLSHWVESIYCLGEYAYGVRDNPTAGRKRRRRNLKPPPEEPAQKTPSSTQKARTPLSPTSSSSRLPPGIPPPIVKAVENSLDKASAAAENADSSREDPPETKPMLASLSDTETWVKYMTLGYGTAWGGKKTVDESINQTTSKAGPDREPSPPAAMRYIEPEPDIDHAEEKRKLQIRLENDGYFLVGLKGDIRDVDVENEDDEGNWNTRIPLRTIHLDVNSQRSPAPSSSIDSDDTPQHEEELDFREPAPRGLARLRPVVYVHRPFIYTFLFTIRTDSLSMASFYRDIHHFFSPLHRSLDRSTSPSKVAARLFAASTHHTTSTANSSSATPNTQPIYDLVFDPRTYTVHTSLPNIPDPGTLIAEGLSSTTALPSALGLSRIDALNIHSQILATITSTRRHRTEIERTQKTARGWWVVWMRLPPSQVSAQAVASQKNHDGIKASFQFNTEDLREAFLVRRARDSAPEKEASGSAAAGRFSASGMWSGLGMGGGSTTKRMGGAGAGWGPKGLADGIGIDARRYVDDLLSLNR
ncbi:hypothetical protein ACN47E_006073 [Coniothyrium glycines]